MGGISYIVAWHIENDGELHYIAVKGFSSEDSAEDFYYKVSSNYAKKLIYLETNEKSVVYSEKWAKYIPEGTKSKGHYLSSKCYDREFKGADFVQVTRWHNSKEELEEHMITARSHMDHTKWQSDGHVLHSSNGDNLL